MGRRGRQGVKAYPHLAIMHLDWICEDLNLLKFRKICTTYLALVLHKNFWSLAVGIVTHYVLNQLVV
ncbi:hypothetical protein ACLOJK_013373 [Asimina triloba]